MGESYKGTTGMMNKVVGEAIGDEIGEFMEMERDEDDSAVGRCRCLPPSLLRDTLSSKVCR